MCGECYESKCKYINKDEPICSLELDATCKMLDFETFCEVNADEIYCYSAESGADREYDYDAEEFVEHIYHNDRIPSMVYYVEDLLPV